MLHHRDVYDKLKSDINKQLGDRAYPEQQDRDSLPYVEAVIFEVLRYISHVPLCLPHKATTDTKIGKYYIPQGTQVSIA